MDNRKTLTPLFCVILLVCSLFTGCSAKKDSDSELNNTPWNMTGAAPEYLTEWPDNTFTETILKPQNGKMDYVLDYTDSGRYAIFIKDISSKESEHYVEELKNNGYSEIHSNADDTAAGTMLESDYAYLSISYSDDVLGILITLRDDTK